MEMGTGAAEASVLGGRTDLKPLRDGGPGRPICQTCVNTTINLQLISQYSIELGHPQSDTGKPRMRIGIIKSIRER
jgi:hypothetical protein